MRVTEREMAVAVALQFHAAAPLRDAAQRLGIQEHVVRYALQRLKLSGVLRAAACIDYFRLGFEEFEILFSIASGESCEPELIQALVDSPRTAWFAELGGDYQYGVRLCARGISDLREYLESLEAKTGVVLHEKEIAAVTGFTTLSKQYLAPQAGPREGLCLAARSGAPFMLDATDIRILDALNGADGSLPSHHQISRSSGVSRPTVDHRLKKMEAAGVIAGYLYFIRSLEMQRLPYVLLLYTRGVGSTLKKKVADYAWRNPAVVGMSECFGSWDFELTIEAREPKETAAIVKSLSHELKQQLLRVRILPVFRQLQSKNFMRLDAAGGLAALAPAIPA